MIKKNAKITTPVVIEMNNTPMIMKFRIIDNLKMVTIIMLKLKTS